MRKFVFVILLLSCSLVNTQVQYDFKKDISYYPDSVSGKGADNKLEDLFSNEKQVNKDTPPAFIVLAADDQVVPSVNGINYFEALIKNDVYASIHVYPTGNHGWGYKESYEFHQAILDELTLWLYQINGLKQ